MEFIMIVFVFLILIGISVIMNILLKTTKKRDWAISLLLSIFVSIIIVAILR